MSWTRHNFSDINFYIVFVSVDYYVTNAISMETLISLYHAAVSKVTNRISMLLQRKTSNNPSTTSGSPTGSFEGECTDTLQEP